MIRGNYPGAICLCPAVPPRAVYPGLGEILSPRPQALGWGSVSPHACSVPRVLKCFYLLNQHGFPAASFPWSCLCKQLCPTSPLSPATRTEAVAGRMWKKNNKPSSEHRKPSLSSSPHLQLREEPKAEVSSLKMLSSHPILAQQNVSEDKTHPEHPGSSAEAENKTQRVKKKQSLLPKIPQIRWDTGSASGRLLSRRNFCHPKPPGWKCWVEIQPPATQIQPGALGNI